MSQIVGSVGRGITLKRIAGRFRDGQTGHVSILIVGAIVAVTGAALLGNGVTRNALDLRDGNVWVRGESNTLNHINLAAGQSDVLVAFAGDKAVAYTTKLPGGALYVRFADDTYTVVTQDGENSVPVLDPGRPVIVGGHALIYRVDKQAGTATPFRIGTTGFEAAGDLISVDTQIDEAVVGADDKIVMTLSETGEVARGDSSGISRSKEFEPGERTRLTTAGSSPVLVNLSKRTAFSLDDPGNKVEFPPDAVINEDAIVSASETTSELAILSGTTLVHINVSKKFANKIILTQEPAEPEDDKASVLAVSDGQAVVIAQDKTAMHVTFEDHKVVTPDDHKVQTYTSPDPFGFNDVQRGGNGAVASHTDGSNATVFRTNGPPIDLSKGTQAQRDAARAKANDKLQNGKGKIPHKDGKNKDKQPTGKPDPSVSPSQSPSPSSPTSPIDDDIDLPPSTEDPSPGPVPSPAPTRWAPPVPKPAGSAEPSTGPSETPTQSASPTTTPTPSPSKKPPGKPVLTDSAVSISGLTHSGFMISVPTGPNSGSQVNLCVITVHALGGKKVSKDRRDDSADCTSTLTGLDPETEYAVEVQVHTEGGWSEAAEKKVTTLKKPVDPSPSPSGTGTPTPSATPTPPVPVTPPTPPVDPAGPKPGDPLNVVSPDVPPAIKP